MTLNKSAGIVTKKSIQVKPATPKSEPLAKKAPPKKTKEPTPKKEVEKAPEAPKKRTRKAPQTKKNPKTKAPAFKPTLMLVFETSNGFGIAQNYLRGAGLTIRAGKTDENSPALQVEGNGTLPKRMLKMFRDYMKEQRVKYKEEKL